MDEVEPGNKTQGNVGDGVPGKLEIIIHAGCEGSGSALAS
jgi:hypothetical protein